MPPASAQTQGGSGSGLDLTTGCKSSTTATPIPSRLANCKTVEDVLNAINGSGAGVLAQINSGPERRGDLLTRLSGSDFIDRRKRRPDGHPTRLRTFNLEHLAGQPQLRRRRPGLCGDPANGMPGQRFHHHPSDGIAV